MENCSHQSNTESYQPNRAEGLSSKKTGFTSITDFIETQQVYNKHQSGYRKNLPTATILSKLHDDIKMAMKQSLQ